MNSCAPADVQARDLLQHVVGSIEFIVYQISLVWLDVSVNPSADSVLSAPRALPNAGVPPNAEPSEHAPVPTNR